MGLDHVNTGKNPPDEINVIIEIPKDAEPVKYEVDKESGAIFVDRVLSTPMRYPCNYGYVPHTLCGDGDPADVLVVLPLSLIPGAVIRCRPVGVLRMSDEAGSDENPGRAGAEGLRSYAHITDITQVSGTAGAHRPLLRAFKDLEKGKWVKSKAGAMPPKPRRCCARRWTATSWPEAGLHGWRAACARRRHQPRVRARWRTMLSAISRETTAAI